MHMKSNMPIVLAERVLPIVRPDGKVLPTFYNINVAFNHSLKLDSNQTPKIDYNRPS